MVYLFTYFTGYLGKQGSYWEPSHFELLSFFGAIQMYITNLAQDFSSVMIHNCIGAVLRTVAGTIWSAITCK